MNAKQLHDQYVEALKNRDYTLMAIISKTSRRAMRPEYASSAVIPDEDINNALQSLIEETKTDLNRRLYLFGPHEDNVFYLRRQLDWLEKSLKN